MNQSKHAFHLGPWLVEPELRQLSADNRTRRISPKAMQVLLLLAKNPGQVVSRDALLDGAWPNVTVGEEVLTHAISELRKNFHDDARAPKIIETVPKSGYRLLPSVTSSGGNGQERRADSLTGQEPTIRSDDPSELLLSDRPAIAVLPFTNMSGDPTQDYFSDGLAEDLIAALYRWRSFPVIARNSTFVYKGRAVEVSRIAGELGARYVLEGSTRKADDRIRVNAQLIDAQTGCRVWGDRYDRDLGDIFALQDEITQCIAAAMVPELGRLEKRRLLTKRPADLDAWECYLRGNACLEEFTPAGNLQARTLFERAVELDPAYSDAYTGLAIGHTRDVLLACTSNRESTLQAALAAARKAVTLDEVSADAHQALSTVHIWRDEYDLAIADAHLAVEYNPNDAVTLHALGNKSDLAGDPEGIPRMLLAQRLNPQDPDRHSHLSFLARAYVNARQYSKSIECARLAIERKPEYPNAHYILAIALGHLGRADEARSALEIAGRCNPRFLNSRRDWRPYVCSQSNEHLRAGLRKAGARV